MRTVLVGLLLVVGIACFVAAAILGAVSAAARLNNVGLALTATAVLVEVVPIG